MKQTPKIKLILYFCLGLFVLNACTLEENVVKEQAHQEKMKLESKSFHELLQTSLFSTAYKKVINKKVTLSNDFAARTALEDQYGFTIVEDQPVKVITDVDGITYYTIAIERDVKEELKFENLVIKVDSTDVGAIILKYELNEKALYNYEHGTYNVDVKETIIEPLEVEGKTIFIPIDCWYVVSITCNNLTGGELPNHIPHSGCFQAAQNDGNINLTYTFTEFCFGADFDLGGDGNPTPIGTPGGEGGGGTGGVGTSTTGPPNPDGITPIGESTPPIKTVIIPSEEVVEEEEIKNPCTLLQKLQLDTFFKLQMKSLLESARISSVENVSVLYNLSIPTPTNNFAYHNANGVSAFSPSAVYNYNTSIQGMLHTHYISNNLISIFSVDDLQDLYDKMKNNLITDDYFSGLVTGKNTAYILQVSNKAAFIAFGDKYLSSDDKVKDFAYYKMAKDYNIQTSNTNSVNELGFLKMMKELKMGLSLASVDFNHDTPATSALFNVWTKKEYNRRNIDSSQCN